MSVRLLVFINQPPWNELILRGARPVKYGGNKVNHTGLALLYTSKSKPDPEGVELLADADPAVLEELAEGGRSVRLDDLVKSLPRGVLVGACQFKCVGEGGSYEYHLSAPRRFAEPVPITKRGPVRFYTTEVTPAIERQLRGAGLWDEAVSSNRAA